MNGAINAEAKMPVVDTPVHEKVREKEGAVYGCWNKPDLYAEPVYSPFSNSFCAPYVYVFSGMPIRHEPERPKV